VNVLDPHGFAWPPARRMEFGDAPRDASRTRAAAKDGVRLPTELTPKLNALVSAMDKPMELRSARYKLQASVAEFAKLQCEP
jgi:hypothetical protein